VDTSTCKNQVVLLLQVVLAGLCHYLESPFKKAECLFNNVPETWVSQVE
jgi:hypothetical protein